MDCYEEEAEIDTSLNGLAQNDPILVDALKNYYLSAAVNEMPYNIEKWRLNQTLLQVSNVRKLEIKPAQNCLKISQLMQSMFVML